MLWFLCSVFVCCSESSFPRPTNLLQGCRKSMCRSRQFVSHVVQTRLSDEACAQMRIRVGVVRQLWCLFTGDCRGAAVPQQSRRRHIWNMDSSRLWILRRAPERWLSYCTEQFFAFKNRNCQLSENCKSMFTQQTGVCLVQHTLAQRRCTTFPTVFDKRHMSLQSCQLVLVLA